MESSELLKWVEEQIRHRNLTERKVEVKNFYSDWSDGVAYHAILFNYRPDLINLNFCAEKTTDENICSQIFEIIEKRLNIKRLVDPAALKDSATALENITYISELYRYFNSKNYVIDKELGIRLETPCYDSVEVESAHVEKPRLSAKLFARKSVKERIHELNTLDGVVFTPKVEMITENEAETLQEINGKSDGQSDEQKDKNEKNEQSDEEKSFESLHKANNPFGSTELAPVNEVKSEEDKEDDNNDDNNNKDTDDSETDNNPFGESDEESDEKLVLEVSDAEVASDEKQADSTNPFGDASDDEDDEDENSSEQPGNPFGDDQEEEKDDEEAPGNPFGEPDVKAKPPPRPNAPPKRPPPPTVPPKKKQAPLPPPNVVAFDPGRPRRPPPPRPKDKAPGHGHPLIKRDVQSNEDILKTEMNEIEDEMKQLEMQGAKLEDMLRFSTNSGNWGHDDDGLMSEWLDIVKKRNQLGRRDTELGYRLRLTRLELKHAELEFEMRKLLSNPDDQTDEDRINEAKIMDEIVVIVDKKDKIVQNIELERERAEVEDIAMSVENKIHIKEKKSRKSMSIKKIRSVLVKKKDKKDKKEKSEKV